MIIVSRTTHDCQQGSDAWKALRANYFTASEAPAMLGVSKYQTRTDLLKQKATGISAEVDSGTQRRFDAGHAAEAAARPIVERIVGEELYPVTMTAEVDGLSILASMDGLTLLGETGWETKLLNQDLRSAVETETLPEHYTVQMEQQIMVSGADRIYFTTTDGTPENTFGMWYTSNPDLRERIVAGWKQFQADLYAYVPAEPEAAAPVGNAPEALPALRIEVTGMVTNSNLPAFREHALAVFCAINTDLQTDADFADAEKAAKWCKEVEDRLEAAKQHALSQTASIDELFRVIDDIKETARQKRLMLDKLVKAEKDARKTEIVHAARKALVSHVIALNERIGGNFIPTPDYLALAEAVKSLKSLDSMRDKVSVALANAKIEANATADRIESNRKTVDDMSLVPDFAAVCTKAADDFAAMLAMRKLQRVTAAEKLLEAERERIRKEEADNLRSQQQATAYPAQHSPQANAPQDGPDSYAASSPAMVGTSIFAGTEPAQSDSGPPTLCLGQINDRLKPVALTADGLASLGFAHVATDKAAKLYRESDFQSICSALERHISAVRAGRPA